MRDAINRDYRANIGRGLARPATKFKTRGGIDFSRRSFRRYFSDGLGAKISCPRWLSSDYFVRPLLRKEASNSNNWSKFDKFAGSRRRRRD